VSRLVVLVVGRSGAASQRLEAYVRRKGLTVRPVADCGAATEVLAETHVGAVVLNVEEAGFGAAAFREMVQQEQPRLTVLEVPPGDVGPEDVALLGDAIESAVREAESRESGQGDEPEGFEGPLHGYKFEDLTSNSPRMLELFQLIPRVAQSDSPVLIVGETGTGKELVAAAIHRQSKRKGREFFTVNCGALTETLLESELFGHEKGAFTGAIKTKKGYFELASSGTLFLDELGTISAAMQVKLLRVLERMEVRRVGGSALEKVDVRIVAATNASLEDAVAAGTFREDLYYRLNVVQLQIPPLRERPEDIPILAEVFRRKYAAEQARDVARIERGALRLLRAYPWPGNVRELENVIERAVILAPGTGMTEADLPERVRRTEVRKTSVPAFDAEEPLATVLHRVNSAVEREYLKRVLKRFRGHLGRTSQHSGLNRRTLYNRMQVHGLKREDFQ
jgi:two-component system, NtrC family, response regulator AtoC